MSATLDMTIDAPTALAVIPAAQVSTIVSADTHDILGKLAAKVAAHEPDPSTPRGRKEIASLAAEVASSKMDLIRLGKGLTEAWRKSTAAVNAECRVIEERMDALKVQVRAPLTAWEVRDAQRVAGHEAALQAMLEIAASTHDPEVTGDAIEQAREGLAAIQGRDWQEFEQRAERTYREALGLLDTRRAAVEARDVARAEAIRLQAEQEERARQEAARIQAERETRIAAQAAERARQEAEAEAERQRQAEHERAAAELRRVQAEADQAAQQAADALRQAEAGAQAAADLAAEERRQQEQAIQVAEERAAQADRDRIAAAEKAERDAADAARRAEEARIAAAQQAEHDRAAAVAAEQRRVAAEAEQDRIEAQRRADDKAHRGRISRDAMAALVLEISAVHSGNADEAAAIAKMIVAAIACRRIPNISIQY